MKTCEGWGVGSGILIGPQLVATVEHVVEDAVEIRLKRRGEEVASAVVIGKDADRDLALLRTTKPIKGSYLRLAVRPPRLGEEVVALGYPLGLPLSVTRGLVSGTNRTIPIKGIQRHKLVQTDAAVNFGNSGGPLISLETGEVLGLVDLGTTEANGIAFAVSTEVARPLLQAWRVAPQPVERESCGQPPVELTTPASSPDEAEVVKGTIRSHWAAINRGDYDRAYDYFSPRLQSAFPRRSWVRDKLIDQPQASPITILSVSVDDSVAYAQVRFSTVGYETGPGNTGCNAWSGSYRLVKLGSEWYIDRALLKRTSLACGG